MKRIFTLLAGIVCVSLSTQAQNLIGFSNTNYAGINGIDYNPSSIVDSRFKLDVALATVDFGFSNNYAGLAPSAFKNRSPFGAWRDYRKGDTTAFDAFDNDQFHYVHMNRKEGDFNKSVTLGTRVMLPFSFMWTHDEKNAFSMTGEFRMMVNVDGISPELANFLYDDFADSAFWGKQFTNKNASIQAMMWHEIGFGYARVLKDDGTNFWKAGVRPKLLLGMGSMYFFAEDIQYETNHQDTITIYGSNVQFGRSKHFDFPNTTGSDALKYNYEEMFEHPGVGLDIGFTYEWRPKYQDYKYDMDGETNLWKKSKNKYELRAAFSITDIGWIKFDRAEDSKNFNGGIDHWSFRDIELEDTNAATVDYMLSNLGDTLLDLFNPVQTKGVYRVDLPTAFRGDVDYHVWNDFYVNLQFAYAVQWKKNPNKVHDLSYIAFTPRYDYKWAGVMIPMVYNQYRDFSVGACLRAGPIFLGTSDLGSYFGKKNDIYGANFYFGVHMPIHFKEPKDRDLDKVSDKKDKCIDTPGIWEFLGCPDTDGDHVQDKEDLCPTEPGLKEFNGCPDRDGDKIIDGQDACPDDPGLQEFNGCPDKDGDKIIDKEDDCPDEPGLKEFKGCPDKDGDGVMDKIDICPEKPGPVENEGCPEVILSLVDLAGQSLKQSKQAKDGSFTYETLPTDSLCVFRLDGDADKTIGVNEVKVIVNGLPKRALRSQVDGLFRFDIPKPVKSGLQKEPEVAPVLTKKEAEILKRAFDNLEFETGKDIIRTTSYASLDTLADLLQKKPEWQLKISGHTDNVGKAPANMKLSEKRAKAVKAYLVKKGVPEDRLITEWWGQTRPIAPNNTPEGRQKNRRVEMLILEAPKK